MQVNSIDHVVLTCEDVSRTAEWYARVLGAEVVSYGEGRTAIVVGAQKINLRPAGADGWTTGATSRPGDLDICFLTDASPEEVVDHLGSEGVEVTEGPVRRSGARGPIISVYCTDPDGSLVEIASQLDVS